MTRCNGQKCFSPAFSLFQVQRETQRAKENYLLEEAKTVIFHFRMDEEFSDAAGGSFIFKDPPLTAAESEVRPRTKPKPKVKSQTVSGIALPGLAEVLNKKKITAEDKVC